VKRLFLEQKIVDILKGFLYIGREINYFPSGQMGSGIVLIGESSLLNENPIGLIIALSCLKTIILLVL
jgi:hypothetical protein